MHEWVDTEITAVLFALAVILAVSLGFAHQVKVRASRRGELLKLRHLAVETIAKAEAEADSMLAGSNLCSICKSPTSRRCSRCKAVRYCSLECQSQHWTEGHKEECKAPSTSSLEISENGNGTVHSLCLRSSQCMTSGDLFRYSNQGNATIDYDKLFPHFSEANGAHKKTSSPHVSKPLSASITSDGIILRPKKILFPYDYFVKLYNWDMLRLPCGLINCGNSCFANVVLQCLTYTRPLTAYLLEGAHAEECRRNDWCFMCELQGHVWRVRQNQTPFSPIRILSRMQNIGNHLGYGRQEDAHEFMRFAIDSMQSTCLDGFGGENVVDPASQQTTLIHHIFGGHLQSQVKCMQCQHESNRYESMMDLAVEIHGIVESLEDALAQFTAPELLDGENKYKCDRCNAYVKADKRLTLHEAPNVLTIALKRFQSGKFGKLNKRVTFPEVLYMGPYMSQKGDEPPVYKLYAVVVHVDMLNASFFGHYICYVKDSQGAWYQIDDSKVKEVEVDKVMSQRAYMLFYSRSFARAAPITDPEPSSAASGEGILEFIRLAVPLEHQQSSILPPMQGAVAVPSSLAKEVSLALGHNDGGTGESSEHGTMQLQRPEFAITGLNFDDFLERKQKLEYIVPLTLAGGESTVEVGSCDQISSSLKVAAGISDSTNASEDLYVNSSQILESVQVFKGKMEHNEMPLESTSLSRQRRVGKISEQGHEVLSLLPSPKLLDMEELPMWEAGNHHKTPAIPVLDVVGSSPSIAWPRNVIDMVSSIDYAVVNSDSQVQSPCCVPEYVAEYNENQTSEESDVWKGDQEYSSVEAMCPHLEGGEMLESMGSRREEGCKCMQDDMDSLALQNCYGASPDEGLELLSAKTSHAQTNSNCGEAGIFQSSSKALLELKTLGSLNAEMHEHKKRMEHTEPTMSLMRTPGANMGPLATTTSSSNCFTVLLDSPGKVLAIKELPGPDVVGRTDCAHVANKGDVENGLELSGLLSGSAVIGEIWPTTVLMPNITGSSSNSELFSDSSVENTAFRVNPVDGTLDDGQEICHNSPIGRINDVKQNLKPLLAPGFLNKSHRLKIVKSVCKDAGVYPDGHSNQGNGWATTSAQTESPPGQTSMLGMNGRSISASVGELEVSDLQGHSSSRASTQLRSYTNHNNGSKDGKKGLMDHISVNRSQSGTSQSHAVSGAFGAEHKQGRNESCACGSQQKWKKCCGKSSVIKGALADRQLVV